MIIPEVCKNPAAVIDNIESVQISILLLRFAHHINRRICHRFQLLVRVLGQRVTDRLDPLCKITILKYVSIETIFHLIHAFRQNLRYTALKIDRILFFNISCPQALSLPVQFSGYPEISHTKAGICLRNPVI